MRGEKHRKEYREKYEWGEKDSVGKKGEGDEILEKEVGDRGFGAAIRSAFD